MTTIAKMHRAKEFKFSRAERNVPILKSVRKIVLALQYARMVCALNRMPDWALNEIGISQSDITQYAKSLIEDGG